jgi:Cytochrome c biogenesis factor
MISNSGIILSWICLLNLLFLLLSNNKFQIQLLVRLNLFFNFLLFCLLEIGLFLNDFSISYIANYSATTTPPVYKFASLWGSLDGSILLWNLILALYFLIYLKYYKKVMQMWMLKFIRLLLYSLLAIRYLVPHPLRDA